MLRREGIYSSFVSSWRMQLGAHGAAGLGAKKAGRKPKLTRFGRWGILRAMRTRKGGGWSFAAGAAATLGFRLSVRGA